MALITANGLDVIEAHYSMPRVGVWVVDLSVDVDSASGFADGATVKVAADGGVTLTGSVLPGRSSEFIGSVQLRVAAGKREKRGCRSPRRPATTREPSSATS
jgi:hypothetical protein